MFELLEEAMLRVKAAKESREIAEAYVHQLAASGRYREVSKGRAMELVAIAHLNLALEALLRTWSEMRTLDARRELGAAKALIAAGQS